VWTLAAAQHGVVSRSQLLALGFSTAAIRHRLRTGRLHRVRHGVYAVGRGQLDLPGHWMAAVLAAGPAALLSHSTAGALWGLLAPNRAGLIELTVTDRRGRRLPEVRFHRPRRFPVTDRARCDGIPVTAPTRTLIDLAGRLPERRLERAVNEGDRLGLIDPESLRAAVDERSGQRGAPTLRKLLDRRTFVLTDSELERRFLPIARAAGQPKPETGVRLNGFKVDFLWRRLGLIVETDGLRYHRTPAQQARDRRRDQAHAAAGWTTLRFTHQQVAHEPDWITKTLTAVASRLSLLGSDRGRAVATPRSS
jgi:very-short-patch-repair endonuclease